MIKYEIYPGDLGDGDHIIFLRVDIYFYASLKHLCDLEDLPHSVVLL